MKISAFCWKDIPYWSIYGSSDKNIPAELMKWMAGCAKAKETIVVKGVSHVVMLSHPDSVAKVIEDAAQSKSRICEINHSTVAGLGTLSVTKGFPKRPMFASPQSRSARSTGPMLSPSGERLYSTLGGTCA